MANDSSEDVFVEEIITLSRCPENVCCEIGFIEEPDSDDSEDEQDDYVSNDAANRRAIAMMMSGQHPDEEIDKLLETFGPSNWTNGFSMKTFFQGEIVSNDMRHGRELADAIDEIRAMRANWAKARTSDGAKKAFLQQVTHNAEAIGVQVAVEHLLPAILEVMKHPSNQTEAYQEYVKILFRELGKLSVFLCESTVSAGYVGIRDYLTPLYQDFFRSDDILDVTRAEL